MNLLVKAYLASPLAGEPPFLDALLASEALQQAGRYKAVDRRLPCPSVESLPVPLERGQFGGLTIFRCSSPILAPCSETVEHIAKRLDTHKAELLAENERRSVSMGRHTYKSYRLPLRVRSAECIAWFGVGNADEILAHVEPLTGIGKKRDIGYGRVSHWSVEEAPEDWSWFAPSERGPVLMRPLPVCAELPQNLIGARRDFGACQPPYFHPERYGEIVCPC